MTITKAEIPRNSLLKTDKINYDYIDSFQERFTDRFQKIGPKEIGTLFFFSSGSKWIDNLFTFRNQLGLFGLKTSGDLADKQKMLDNVKCSKGEQLGLFKVFEKTADEIILGEDDKHLNFRVSLFIDKRNESQTDKNLIISTTIKFNNWFGRLYFVPVRPFHKLIVPTMLKGMIKSIDGKSWRKQRTADYPTATDLFVATTIAVIQFYPDNRFSSLVSNVN